MRSTVSRLRSLMQAHPRKLAMALVILGTCSIVTGAILIANLPVPYDPIDATFLMGSTEILLGVVAVGLSCWSIAAQRRIWRTLTNKRVILLVSTIDVLSSFWMIPARSARFRETAELHSNTPPVIPGSRSCPILGSRSEAWPGSQAIRSVEDRICTEDRGIE